MSVPHPSITQTIVDGGLAITPASNDGVFCKVGTSSTGTAGFHSYAGTDANTVGTDLGEGPLPDATVKHLEQSGGKQTVALKVAASVAGSSSAVTQSGGGPAVTISSGTPYDYGLWVVKIITGGAVATATFQYSSNGGADYSDTVTTAATYALPSGVTIAFAAGTYVANETYSWTDTAPAMNASDVGTALDDIIDSSHDVEAVHLLGYGTTAAAMATIAATISTKIASAHASKRYLWVMFEEPPVDNAGVAAAFAAVAEKFLVGMGGFADITENRSGQVEKMPIARTYAPRIARNPIEVHPMRDAGDSNIDALGDVVRLVPDGAAASTGYHDEGRTPLLNAARHSCLSTIPGATGFYPADALTLASGTSDFQQLMYMRIILKAARASHAFQIRNLAKRIRINPATGFIDAKTRIALQGAWESFIKTALGNAIGVVRVVIAETDLNADPTVYSQVRGTVDGYALVWSSTIGLASSLPAAA